jgi:hypothetical protein
MDRLDEVGGLEGGRERKNVTEQDAEQVAFRGDVIRRDHGREMWRDGGVDALRQMF